MKHIVKSDKSVTQAVNDLSAAVKEHSFGVLHTYDMKQTLKDKGVDFPQEVRILEICNPKQAAEVMAEDLSLNMALPCQISVWEDEGGGTNIGMIKPSAILSRLSDSPKLAKIANDVEAKMVSMIEQAK